MTNGAESRITGAEGGRCRVPIECDLQRLENVLQAFTQTTGIGADVLRGDFTLILQQFGRQWNARCQLMAEKDSCGAQLRGMLRECGQNRSSGRYLCPAGLLMLAVPIQKEDSVMGYLLLGPMRTAKAEGAQSCAVQSCIGTVPQELRMQQQYLASLPFFGGEKTESLLCMADMLAKYILQESILVMNTDRNMETVIDFINRHLDYPLTVQTVVQNTHISKSVLYKIIHEHFHCTLGELVMRKKTEEAVRMLLGTDRPVEEIAQILAFSSPSYFSRVFKRLYGETPHRYRRRHQKE